MSSFAVLGKGPRGPPGPPGSDGPPGRDGNTSLIPVAHFLTTDEFTGSQAVNVARVWNWDGTGEPDAVSADDMYLVAFSIYGDALTTDEVTAAYVEWLPEVAGAEGLSYYAGHCWNNGLFCVAGSVIVGGAAAAAGFLNLRATCPNSTKTTVTGNVFVWKLDFPAESERS